MGQEIGRFLGEGGAILEMALPLSENYQEQVQRGRLRRINDDGSLWTPQADAPAADAQDAGPVEPVPPAGPAQGVPTAVRPAQSDNKSAWVAWAVACGANPDVAEADTKNGLIEKYGSQ